MTDHLNSLVSDHHFQSFSSDVPHSECPDGKSAQHNVFSPIRAVTDLITVSTTKSIWSERQILCREIRHNIGVMSYCWFKWFTYRVILKILSHNLQFFDKFKCSYYLCLLTLHVCTFVICLFFCTVAPYVVGQGFRCCKRTSWARSCPTSGQGLPSVIG